MSALHQLAMVGALVDMQVSQEAFFKKVEATITTGLLPNVPCFRVWVEDPLPVAVDACPVRLQVDLVSVPVPQTLQVDVVHLPITPPQTLQVDVVNMPVPAGPFPVAVVGDVTSKSDVILRGWPTNSRANPVYIQAGRYLRRNSF